MINRPGPVNQLTSHTGPHFSAHLCLNWNSQMSTGSPIQSSMAPHHSNGQDPIKTTRPLLTEIAFQNLSRCFAHLYVEIISVKSVTMISIWQQHLSVTQFSSESSSSGFYRPLHTVYLLQGFDFITKHGW